MQRLLSLLLFMLIPAAVACGGSSSPTTENGRLVDSPVSGLTYRSGALTGLTGENGEFKYERAGTVVFEIAGLRIGEAPGAAIVTPLDFAEAGRATDIEVANVVAFLMMLDEDGDPANGLRISDDVIAAEGELDWTQVDFTDALFGSQPALLGAVDDVERIDGVEHPVPTAEEAAEHLTESVLCAASGVYVGRFSGDDRGPFAVGIDSANGNVGGHGFSETDGVHFFLDWVEGAPLEISRELPFISGTVTSGARFEGNLIDFERIEGEWSNPMYGDSGSLAGSRIGASPNSTVLRYTAIYYGDEFGDDFGLLTVNVDADDRVTGQLVDASYEVTDISGTISGVEPELALELTTGSGQVFDGVLYKTAEANPFDDVPGLGGAWVSGNQAGTFFGSGCRLR